MGRLYIAGLLLHRDRFVKKDMHNWVAGRLSGRLAFGSRHQTLHTFLGNREVYRQLELGFNGSSGIHYSSG